MIKIKKPKKKSIKEIKRFFKKKGLSILFSKNSNKPHRHVNKRIPSPEPYEPDLRDLYKLYQYVILNKRTTILEFGSGWSSLIFSVALNELKKQHSETIKKHRRSFPFELFILENEKKFLNITKKRILKFNKCLKIKKPTKINYYHSKVRMVKFQDRIATEYNKLPTCNPDFIYLDGPDLFKVKKNVNGISVRSKDMMPMVCDLIKLEFFFIPGTIIVCDGRSANAYFLKNHFKRKWVHKHDIKNDQHIFYLIDPVLGEHNKKLLKFYYK